MCRAVIERVSYKASLLHHPWNDIDMNVYCLVHLLMMFPRNGNSLYGLISTEKVLRKILRNYDKEWLENYAEDKNIFVV